MDKSIYEPLIESRVGPTWEQIEEMLAHPEFETGMVIIIQAVKYDPNQEVSFWDEYALPAVELIKKIGGDILHAGRVAQLFVGSDDHHNWDGATMVMYPSRRAFLEMLTSPEYLKIYRRRDLSLIDSILLVIPCEPLPTRL